MSLTEELNHHRAPVKLMQKKSPFQAEVVCRTETFVFNEIDALLFRTAIKCNAAVSHLFLQPAQEE